MSWLKRFFGIQIAPQERTIILYVRCDRCQSTVAVRIDRYNDLAVEYNAREVEVGYVVNKSILDAKCFRTMQATLTFDTHRTEQSRTISGGTFIDEATYRALHTNA